MTSAALINQTEHAYARARARGRSGRASRRNLRRAAAAGGFHVATDTMTGAHGRLCSRCGRPLVPASGWYIHVLTSDAASRT